MELKTYIQFALKDTRFFERQDITKNLDLLKTIELVRISCRLEEDVTFRGKKETLVSIDLGEMRYDFTQYNNLPEEKRHEVYRREIAKILNERRFVVRVDSEEKNVSLGHFIRYYNTSHPEADGKAYRVKSNELWDIRLPNDCERFDTYDRLEKKIVIKGKQFVLQSAEINTNNYLIADLVEGMVQATLNGDIPYIKYRNGHIGEMLGNENLISPKNINKDGSINVNKLKPLKYDDVKNEILGD